MHEKGAGVERETRRLHSFASSDQNAACVAIHKRPLTNSSPGDRLRRFRTRRPSGRLGPLLTFADVTRDLFVRLMAGVLHDAVRGHVGRSGCCGITRAHRVTRELPHQVVSFLPTLASRLGELADSRPPKKRERAGAPATGAASSVYSAARTPHEPKLTACHRLAPPDGDASANRANRLPLSQAYLRFPKKPDNLLCRNRFRAIPCSPQPRLEIAGFAQSAWYRFRGAVHSPLHGRDRHATFQSP